MSKYYTELRIPRKDKSLSWDIAHHLYVQQFSGPAIVVTDKPAALVPSVSKQWRKIIGQAQLECSRTLDPARTSELTNERIHAEQLRFTARIPSAADADVFFVTIDQLLQASITYHTLYIVGELEGNSLDRLANNIQEQGIVVIYHPV